MLSKFSKNIAPFVSAEIEMASKARILGNIAIEFTHYENAHIIGQESTFWHVKVHILMLQWAVRNSRFGELLGQVFRIFGAATKTAFGLVPKGNTGGANISPFKIMPIKAEHQVLIDRAKSCA